MKLIKLQKDDYTIFQITLTPKTWEEIKKAGDKELYKKFNKYADYEELRIYLNEEIIELEAHCIKCKN